MGSYNTVFFDAANTLLYPFPSVGTLYAEVATRYGVTTSATEVQTAFRHAWGQIQPQAQADLPPLCATGCLPLIPGKP